LRIAHLFQFLFHLDDVQFVIELHRALLGREPDPYSLYFHLHRLRSGIPKVTVVADLLQGAEAAALISPAPPRDCHPTAWGYLVAQSQDPHFMQEHFRAFILPDDPHPFEPKGFQPATRQLIVSHVHAATPDPFVAAIPGGRVWGKSGGIVNSSAVISPDNKVIWDVSSEFRNHPWEHPVFSGAAMPPAQYVPETVALLHSPGCFNYYHWMFEVLPRFELLRLSGMPVDKYAINRHIRQPFQEETLAILGIPPEKIIDLSGHCQLRAKKLVVTSLPGRQGYLPAWAGNFLRHHFVEKRGLRKKKGYERIYLSRSYAKHRHILNEAEVINMLGARGFVALNTEFLSVAEQAEIFYSAEAIVAPHGAALTNIVFCDPGTKIIEIFPEHYQFPCFPPVCKHYRLDYYFLVGRGYPRANHEWGVLAEDMTINVDELRQMLGFAGIV
jgi:hypothetical protein